MVSVRRPQPIADSGFGENEVRAFRVGFDLLSDLPHIYPQVLRIGKVIPQLTKQEFVREYLAGVLDHETQQIVFLGRKLHFLVRQLNDPTHEVDTEITDMENRSLAVHLQLVPHRGAHAREQLFHSEWLGDVVVGTQIQCRDLAGLVPAA